VTPDGLARTHAAAFGANRSWPARDFAAYLQDPTIAVFGTDMCFAVIRRMGPEAEILTLATHPDVQGEGQATAMLRAALDTMARARIEEVFLEVSDANISATALYLRCGFVAFASRPAYYADGTSAICMKLELSPTSAA